MFQLSAAIVVYSKALHEANVLCVRACMLEANMNVSVYWCKHVRSVTTPFYLPTCWVRKMYNFAAFYLNSGLAIEIVPITPWNAFVVDNDILLNAELHFLVSIKIKAKSCIALCVVFFSFFQLTATLLITQKFNENSNFSCCF